jgi:hypothetical protein
MKFTLIAVGLMVVAVSFQSAVADESAAPGCNSPAQCNTLGTAAYKKGDYRHAADLFNQQVALSEDRAHHCELDGTQGKNCAAPVEPYNNVALAWLRAGEPMKARAWLELAPAAPATEHNKVLVGRALSDWHWPAGPEGEYWSYAGYGTWNEIDVAKSGEQWRISFAGYWFPPAGLDAGPNMGDFDAVLPIKDGVAVYHPEDGQGCVITMKFSADRVKVDQDGPDASCGFGMNVDAGGEFARVSTKAETPKDQGGK